MLVTAIIVLHVWGACVWIGAHVVLLTVILPAARRASDARQVVEFERAFGKWGLASLLVQVATGLHLAGRWIGDWNEVLHASTPAGRLVIAKLALLAATLALAGHAARRLVPALTTDSLPRFTWHVRLVTLSSVLLLLCGVVIRTGGVF